MERKITNIKERILYFTDFKGFSKEKFFEELQVTYGNFKGKAKNQALGSDIIERIIAKYPEINAEWLLTGEGEMLKNTGNISISGNNTGIANTGIITGDVSSGNTIADSNITIERKTENNTEDISNLLDSYNANKGVEIDRLQVLYTTMLEGKDAIIEEKNLLIQELKETIQELREDKKHLKSILDKENN